MLSTADCFRRHIRRAPGAWPDRARPRPRFAAALAALLILAGGCVPTYEARLRAYRDRGDLASAERLLSDAQTLDIESADIWRERGILALDRGELVSAATRLERALEKSPDDARATFYRAVVDDRLGRWPEATAGYRRAERVLAREAPPAPVEAALVRQRHAVDQRRIADRVERAISGEAPAPERILFLPMDIRNPTPTAQTLRLGLTAVLIDDWSRMPAIEPVPFAELRAFMTALGVGIDERIDAPTREQLAILTGASHVVYGWLSEVNGAVTLEPRILDRLEEDEEKAVTRLEYLHGRVGTLLDLEKSILFRTARALAVELSPAQLASLRVFATSSPLALQLFGESLWLWEKDDPDAARDRIQRAAIQDPDFALAQDVRLVMDASTAPAVAGDPTPLRTIVEGWLRSLAMRRLQSGMLAQASVEVGQLGGPAGESMDLSINRPVATGSVTIITALPRPQP